MTQIHHCLKNVLYHEPLTRIFNTYSDKYEYTENEIFRIIDPINCPICNCKMVHNGYNIRTKRFLGEVKIGRYICSECGYSFTEESSFWNSLKSNFFDELYKLSMYMKQNSISFEVQLRIIRWIYPIGEATINKMVRTSIDNCVIPSVRDIQIVHYDEQHPKAGRNQKYRLTLIDARSKQVIADELGLVV